MPSPVARDHQQTWGLGATPSYDRVRPPGAPESPQLSTPLADAVRRASRPPADDGMSSSNSATTETRTRVSLGELLTSSGSTRSSLFERGRRVVRGRGARRGAAAPFRRRAATRTRKVVSRREIPAARPSRQRSPRRPAHAVQPTHISQVGFNLNRDELDAKAVEDDGEDPRGSQNEAFLCAACGVRGPGQSVGAPGDVEVDLAERRIVRGRVAATPRLAS